MGDALYDTIGTGYAATRRGDPRIAARILDALDGCATVVNVGAGAGSYEPHDRWVLGVEPSAEMIRQRPPGAAPCIQAAAEALPFLDASVDATTAFLTLHHWSDRARGLAELRRVARRKVVILTWLPEFGAAFWPNAYFTDVQELDRDRFPSIASLEQALGPLAVETVPVAHDCADGFYGAYWRRPEAYLDPDVRAGISVLRQITPDALARGLASLSADLASGAWRARFGDLLERTELDLGYRLVTTRS